MGTIHGVWYWEDQPKEMMPMGMRIMLSAEEHGWETVFWFWITGLVGGGDGF